MVKNKKLKMVILYMIIELNSKNYIFNRMKLIKLMFIGDYIAKNGNKMNIGKTISGITYRYYNQGAFSEEIVNALNDMNHNEIIEINKDNYVTYIIDDYLRFKVNLTEKEKKILNFVIREYGDYYISSILNIVYNIPEMEKAKPLEIILK